MGIAAVGASGWFFIFAGLIAAVLVLPSIRRIGPTEVGLVMKRFSWNKLPSDNPIGFHGEAGYQAQLLMPGLRFKFWVIYRVEKHPWVQVPAGEIGVVIAQVGSGLPIGAKSAVYKPIFGNFSDLAVFMANGGQKGVQRPVLPPGTLMPIHPVAFLVITKNRVYGVPISPDLQAVKDSKGGLMPQTFGLELWQLDILRIAPRARGDHGEIEDVVGIVTTLEGDPLPSGAIASRLGGFADIGQLEKGGASDADLIECILGS